MITSEWWCLVVLDGAWIYEVLSVYNGLPIRLRIGFVLPRHSRKVLTPFILMSLRSKSLVWQNTSGSPDLIQSTGPEIEVLGWWIPGLAGNTSQSEAAHILGRCQLEPSTIAYLSLSIHVDTFKIHSWIILVPTLQTSEVTILAINKIRPNMAKQSTALICFVAICPMSVALPGLLCQHGLVCRPRAAALVSRRDLEELLKAGKTTSNVAIGPFAPKAARSQMKKTSATLSDMVAPSRIKSKFHIISSNFYNTKHGFCLSFFGCRIVRFLPVPGCNDASNIVEHYLQ